MKEKDDKVLNIVGTLFVIAVVGGTICGALDAFGVSTGVIGIIFAVILVVPIALFLLYCACHWFLSKTCPSWEENKLNNWSIGVVIFLIINFLVSVLSQA